MAINLLLDPLRLLWIGNCTTACGPVLFMPIEPLRDPGPAAKPEEPKPNTERDRIRDPSAELLKELGWVRDPGAAELTDSELAAECYRRGLLDAELAGEVIFANEVAVDMEPPPAFEGKPVPSLRARFQALLDQRCAETYGVYPGPNGIDERHLEALLRVLEERLRSEP